MTSRAASRVRLRFAASCLPLAKIPDYACSPILACTPTWIANCPAGVYSIRRRLGGKRCRVLSHSLQWMFARSGGRSMSAGHRKLKPQHAPKAPHEDPTFLESTPARPLRILAEYIHPLVQLKREGIGDTIVMFGSARIEAHETAQARCTRLKNEKTSKMSAAKLTKHRADVRHAKSLLEMSRYYE